MAAKQSKVGNPDTERKEAFDKRIGELYKDLRIVQKQAGNVSKQLKKLFSDKDITAYLLRLDDLDTKANNIAKEMREQIKKRVELFGNEDAVNLADVPEGK